MLYILILTIAIFMAAIVNMVVNWRMFLKTRIPGTGFWAAGGTALFLGMGVFVLRLVDSSFPVMLGNSCVLICFAIFWQGARRFGGLDLSVWVTLISLVVFGGVVVAGFWFSEVKPSMVLRGAIISAGMAVFSLGAGNTLFVCRFESRAVTVTGAVFSFYAVFNCIRMVHAVIDPGPTSIMATEGFFVLYFLVSFVFLVTLSLGQIFMVRDALGEQGEEIVPLRHVLL